jgi:PAS domain S-box-containing protein
MSAGRESFSGQNLAERLKRLRPSQASIGRIIFGSFLLLLAIIVGTSVVSVLAIHRLNDTFAELQRLQRVGDLAEEIDRRMNELRLAARDFLSEPNPQAAHVREPAAALAQLLQDARPELALDQKDLIDDVIARLSNYREGFEKIAPLTDKRRELLGLLPSLDQRFNAAVAAASDRDAAANLLRDQSKIAAALLAHDTASAEKTARDMRGVAIAEPAVRGAADAYADDIVQLAATEAEINRLDSEVLGSEGSQISRVTDQLRDVSARRGHTLANGFARTLLEARWQSILTGIICLLVGLSAAVFVVRRTVRPLAAIAAAIRALAAGSRATAIPDTELHNEIGDIARAAEVFRQTREEADAAREAAVRALAEQKLAEESYEKLFESSIEGIYVTTPQGQILNANPALARIMGYDTPEALINATSNIARTIYLDPEMRAEFARRMERDGMVRDFVYLVRRKDGDLRWLSDSSTTIRDGLGRVIRYEGTVRDITDQKRAEAALADSRRRLQEVIDTVPAVINVKDTDLRYVLMNRYMARIFNIDPDEAIGRTTSELMARYGASKESTHDERVLATGRELGFYEDAYHDHTGTLRHWIVNKVPLRDSDGNVQSILSVALDIGDRKKSEQEILKARDAAEAALKDLRETQASLIEAEKLAALGRLVAGVAHEVNNPVGISLTVASALQRRNEQFAAEFAHGDLRRSSLNEFLRLNHEAAEQLVANLNRAAELVQSFKQVAVDRNFSDRRQFNLRDLTEQVVTSLRPGLGKQNLSLTVECPDDLQMNSYPGPYGQVLTNLFVNALAHAFPPGGMARDNPGKMEIRIVAAGPDMVEIIFADNGRGMSDEIRRRAFDPFFTTRRDQGGTGLGLHIVYNIVTSRLGGRISLSSEEGKGTQVRLLLPRIAPLEAAAAE